MPDYQQATECLKYQMSKFWYSLMERTKDTLLANPVTTIRQEYYTIKQIMAKCEKQWPQLDLRLKVQGTYLRVTARSVFPWLQDKDVTSKASSVGNITSWGEWELEFFWVGLPSLPLPPLPHENTSPSTKMQQNMDMILYFRVTYKWWRSTHLLQKNRFQLFRPKS